MQFHNLKPKTKRKKGKRVGRGGKRGTYSGRGLEGQKSRAGRKMKPAIRDFIKRYPKLRGYRFGPKPRDYVVLNLDIIGKKFKEGEIVSPQTLLEKRIVRRIKGKVPGVKILARGQLKKALSFKGCLFSQKAKEEIEKAGGKIKEEK